MSKRIITQFDMDRLRSMIAGASQYGAKLRDRLDVLEKELDRAVILEAKRVPKNVVTMHSRVHLTRIDSGQESIYELVFPSDADIAEGKISILAPIGTALLGQEIGTVVEWSVPSGRIRMKIEKIIYQPESSGHYDR